MTCRPPTPPPSVDMPNLAWAIVMMATTLQQQSATMAQQRQVALHPLETTRLEAEASHLPQQAHTFSLEIFPRHNPPKFNGKVNPDEVDQRVRDIKRIFEATQCPEERKLSYAIYMLIEEAEFWWISMKQMMEDRGEDATLENFKVRFREEYFPHSVRYEKEIEFMQLEQGNVLVTEYATRVKHLARFYTQTMIEAWRCRKFEFGLKQELKEVVIHMSIRDFPALVEKAKVVEILKSSSRLAKPQVGGPSKSMPKYEDRKKPYFGPQSYTSGRSSSQSPPSLKCDM